jgi:hypothetical protein
MTHKNLAARLKAQAAAHRRQFFATVPGSRARYQRAYRLMGGQHGALHWDGHHYTDASWESHEVRHVFGIRDPWDWAGIEAALQRNGLATYCGFGIGEPDNWEQAALEEWGELSIHLHGILWVAERYPARPEAARTWWCDDCQRTCLSCGAPVPQPLEDFCEAHHPRRALEED